jgi:N-methylhydantoinase B
VHTQSAGGGGFGNPKDRDPERVRADLCNGYVTPEGAKVYGLSDM